MRKTHARYEIEKESRSYLLIRDTGHDQGHPTVTNDVEHVLADLAPRLHGRALYYIDSDGRTDQILYTGERFCGFAPGWKVEVKP